MSKVATKVQPKPVSLSEAFEKGIRQALLRGEVLMAASAVEAYLRLKEAGR